MTLLEQVKKELRISHTDLDTLIPIIIEEARMDMIRAGLASEVVELSEDPLVNRCIKDFVLMQMADQSLREKYENAYKYEVDCLRKSSGYRL